MTKTELWAALTVEQRSERIEQCAKDGHDFRYIENTYYRWDCTRCNWFDVRYKPTLPLQPSMPRTRFELVQNW